MQLAAMAMVFREVCYPDLVMSLSDMPKKIACCPFWLRRYMCPALDLVLGSC